MEAIIAEYEPRAVLPPDRARTIVIPVSGAPASESRDASGFLDNWSENDRRSGGGKSSTSAPGIDEDRRTGDRDESPSATVGSTDAGVTQFERRVLIQFSAHEAVMTKLERVRSMAAHRLRGNASLEDLIEFLADYFTEREDPALHWPPSSTRGWTPGQERERHVGRSGP